MEPVSILVASATYLAAEVARKPADVLATKLWETVKAALRKILEREPTPADVSVATIRKAAEEVPAVAGRCKPPDLVHRHCVGRSRSETSYAGLRCSG
jgi:hypothetical protein